jgi:hypothetical protein
MINLETSVTQNTPVVKRNNGLDNHDPLRTLDGRFMYLGKQAAGSRKRFARQMDKERRIKEQRPEAAALQVQYGFSADDCVFL